MCLYIVKQTVLNEESNISSNYNTSQPTQYKLTFTEYFQGDIH